MARTKLVAVRTSLVLAVLGLGLLLRIWNLGRQSLTMDEIGELRLATLPVRSIITAADGFPPFYHLLLHLWPEALTAGAGARWLSVAFGMLALPVIWSLGREVNGKRTGWWSVLLLAISPIHNWLSQELRAYGLYFVLTLTATWLFVRAVRTDRVRDWILYATSVLCGLYTHYYFGFLLLALAFGMLLEPASRRRWRRLLLTHAAVLLLALPLLFLVRGDLLLQQGYRIEATPLDLSTLGYTFFTFVAGFSVGLSLRELHTASPGEGIRAVLPWTLVLAPVIAYLLFVGWSRTDPRRRWWSIALVLAVPIAGAGVLASVLGVGYRIRYVSWCVGPFLVLIAMGLAAIRDQRRAAALFAVLAAISGVALVNRQTNGRYMNEDGQSIARQIEARVDRSTPIFVVAGYMSGVLQEYLEGPWNIRPLTATAAPNWSDDALQQVRKAGSPGSRFWLVYSRPFHGDPSGQLRSELAERAGLRLVVTVPGMELYEGSVW